MAYRIEETAEFSRWLRGLKDSSARVRILARLRRLASGNAGDARPVGAGVSELRVNYGPGYRVYYKQQGQRLLLVLCGGNKNSQQRDILLARKLAAEYWSKQP